MAADGDPRLKQPLRDTSERIRIRREMADEEPEELEYLDCCSRELHDVETMFEFAIPTVTCKRSNVLLCMLTHVGDGLRHTDKVAVR